MSGLQYDLLNQAKKLIDKKYKPDGYSIGWNVGKVGGQEVFHAHLHIIPNYMQAKEYDIG